jgi:hypothetical protein
MVSVAHFGCIREHLFDAVSQVVHET